MTTYARQRLRLGIGAVGSTVLLALAAVAFALPHRLLPPSADTSFASALAAIFLAVLVHAALLAPFDVLGGVVVVRESPGAARWLGRVLRALVVQWAFLMLAVALVMRMAQHFGTAAALAVAVLLQLALVHRQGWMARLASGVRTRAPSPAVLEAARDVGLPASRLRAAEVAAEPAFTGGWVGLGGPTLWFPAHWERALDAGALRAQLARRVGVLTSGLRRRGVLVAIAWNTAGLVLALQLPRADLVTAAGVVTVMAYATLWSFVGVLVLPSRSRPAVLAADAFGAAATTRDDVARTVRTLDALQDDEPARSEWVERIFHPVPAREARLAALAALPEPIDARAAAQGAWHATRMMLYTSGGALGLLGRAVHCNVGRPGLWVLYPGD